jgi:hypothetical protein
MAVVRVQHTIGDLAADLSRIPVTFNAKAPKVVAKVAREGNRIAKGFAQDQHTMNSSIDVPYHKSFTAEQLGPTLWEYGPIDDGIKHGGSQATGYEFGSRNQPAHLDLARSRDIVSYRLGEAAESLIDRLFW